MCSVFNICRFVDLKWIFFSRFLLTNQDIALLNNMSDTLSHQRAGEWLDGCIHTVLEALRRGTLTIVSWHTSVAEHCCKVWSIQKYCKFTIVFVSVTFIWRKRRELLPSIRCQIDEGTPAFHQVPGKLHCFLLDNIRKAEGDLVAWTTLDLHRNVQALHHERNAIFVQRSMHTTWMAKEHTHNMDG